MMTFLYRSFCIMMLLFIFTIVSALENSTRQLHDQIQRLETQIQAQREEETYYLDKNKILRNSYGNCGELRWDNKEEERKLWQPKK